MVKRLAIVVFCIGLMGLWSTDAKAWPASSSGWYVKSGSIIVSSGWVHISNTDVKPTDLVATIRPTFLIYYKNPAEKEGGEGIPFNQDVLVGLDQLNPLSGHGKAESNIEFPGPDYKTWLDWLKSKYDLSSFAPNPQWEAIDAKLTGFDVTIQAYADVSDYCNESNTPDSDWTSCYLNTDFTLYEEEVVHIEGLCAAEPLDKDGNFPCVESEHWEYSKKDPFWP